MPARPTHNVHVPAGLPIDELTRPELMDAGNANVENINVRHDQRGALERRLGFAGTAALRFDGSTRTSALRLFEHKGVPQIVVPRNNGVFLDSHIGGRNRSISRGRLPDAAYTLRDVPTPSATAVLTDVEYANGYVALAHLTTSGIRVTVVDEATSLAIRPPEEVGSSTVGGYVVIGSVSDRYFVAVVSLSGGDVEAYILDTQSIAAGWSLLATVASAAAASVTSVSVATLNDRVAIAYATTSGTNRLSVKTYDETGVLATTTIGTSSVTPGAIDLDGTSTLWVCWGETDTAKIIGLDPATLSTTATTATITVAFNLVGVTGVAEGPANEARVWVMDSSDLSSWLRPVTISGGAATVGAGTDIVNAVPASRPFYQDGRFFIAAYGGAKGASIADPAQGLCTIVDWTDDVPYLRPVAHIEPGLVAKVFSSCKVPATSATARVFAIQTIKSGSQDVQQIVQGNGAIGTSLVSFDFRSRERFEPCDHANSTFLGGGLTSVFDGECVTEVGFLCKPPKPIANVAAGSAITGTYRYVAIYEDVDAAGNVTVSGVSEPSDPDTVTTDNIIVSAKSLSISSRIARGNVRIAFYRTLDGGEPPYYRVAAVENDLTLLNTSYEDSTTDDVLATRPKLYAPNLPGAPSEAQDRRAPGGLEHLVSYNGMLVGSRGESLFWSGQEVYGEATWFSPVFQVACSGGGDITALATQDGTIFIFKRDRIFAVAGEAPSDNGLVGGLGAPRLLASDVGCIDAASVVVTSIGIFFRSDRGLEILTRSQNVEYIGEPIRRTLESYPVVSSAVLDERNALVRFSLARSEEDGIMAEAGDAGDGGRWAIFDLTSKMWSSIDRVSNGDAAQSACVVEHEGEQRYAWVNVAGGLLIEKLPDDATAYLDNTNETIPASFTTPPLKLNLQGEQKTYDALLLFERYAPAGLAVEVAYDYSRTFEVADAKTWTAAEVVQAVRQLPFRPKPNTIAMQFRVQDTAVLDPGNGRGLSFIGISADIVERRGTTRGTTRITPELRR